MTERFWKKGYEFGLRGIRLFLLVTFIAVLIATLTECQPFDHYWQVVPPPKPQCRQGYAHLLSMGVTDIVTDMLLVCFPIPIILRSGMPLKRKISLIALFSMPLILIGITAARIPLVIDRRGLQQFRSVFASSEILAAAAVANAIILGSFLRDRGIKKQKYRFSSTTDSMDRRSSTRRATLQQWGSDEDLARGCGYRTRPELAEQHIGLPRPAPVADLDLLAPSWQPASLQGSDWHFSNRQSNVSQFSGSSEITTRAPDDPLPTPRGHRRVSFCDVGGLLEGGSYSSAAPSPTDSVIAHDFAASPRRGSRASSSLATNGRTHAPPARRSSRLSQQSEDHETTARPNQQLQDLRGFLCENDEIVAESSNSSTPHASDSRHASDTQPLSAEPQYPPMARSPTQTTRGSVPSLQDAGGLLSSLSSRPS